MAVSHGVDVSRHQGNITWSKTAQAGAKFACCRLSVGNYYQDATFTPNYNGAKAAGLKVGAYHVVTPEYPYSSQMAWLLKTLANRELDFPLVLDCELDRGQGATVIYSCIKKMVRECTKSFGVKPIIYTRATWWNPWVGDEDFDCDLWVANYSVDEPLMPRAWDKWLMWQYSADGNGQGSKYGAESNSIDLDWWECGGATPPPPPAALTLEQRVARLEAAVQAHGWEL